MDGENDAKDDDDDNDGIDDDEDVDDDGDGVEDDDEDQDGDGLSNEGILLSYPEKSTLAALLAANMGLFFPDTV